MSCCCEAGNGESGMGNRVSDSPIAGVLPLTPPFSIPHSPFPAR